MFQILTIPLENIDMNPGFETFLRFINRILDKHAPIKTVKKEKQRNIYAMDNKKHQNFNKENG